MSKTEGTIKPHSSARIIIEFYPQKTTNYYERVFCVVRNHAVMYVDLVGTCFDVLNKPMPLMQRHVDIYRHKVIMGIHNKVRKVPKVRDPNATEESDDDRASENMSEMDLEYNQEIPIDDPSQVVLHKEMFNDITAENRDLRLSADFLDFAFAHVGRASQSQQLIFTNKFAFPVEVNWTLLNVYNRTSEKWVKNPFKIRPECQVVDANSEFNFQAEFCPFDPD
jgi:hypothetical protein